MAFAYNISRHISRWGVSLATTLFAATQAWGLSAGEAVDNFRLVDHKGVSHEFHYLSDMKAVVLIAQGNSCDASLKAGSDLETLRSKYEAQNVRFLMINSNLNDTREAIAKAAVTANIKIPILVDETQLIGESLGLVKNGEILVVNPQGWKLAYRGVLAKGKQNYVADALNALVSGGTVKTAVTTAGGGAECTIHMPERDKRKTHANISYEKTIAPILIDKCVTCHRTGGIGPWQMSGYDMVRGFAPMIREVIRTERMPPWHADPHYGVFSNNRALSNDQIKNLIHWIEAGAPRGAGSDPLAQYKKAWPTWELGEPDLVIEIPSFTVPPTGVIPYQMTTVRNPLDRDVWVRAIDYLPGERSVVHHIIATVGAAARGGTSLSNYVPGAQPLQIPPEDGILLKKGSTFHFQVHYTPTGKEVTDTTRLGLYFKKETPKYLYRSAVFANPLLKIPANVKEHVEVAATTFKKDALIYTLHPHSHFRGRAASFVAHYPDGREEMLLNVPRYDFNWQATYELATPKILPAGTRVVYTTVFDNSVQNKANPDPNRVVTWGEQTWDEMVYGVIRYRQVVEDGMPNVPVYEAPAAASLAPSDKK